MGTGKLNAGGGGSPVMSGVPFGERRGVAKEPGLSVNLVSHLHAGFKNVF